MSESFKDYNDLNKRLSDFRAKVRASNFVTENIQLTSEELDNAFSEISKNGKLTVSENQDPTTVDCYEQALGFLAYSDIDQSNNITEDEADYFKCLDKNDLNFSTEDFEIAKGYAQNVAKLADVDENSDLIKDFASNLETDDFSNLLTNAIEGNLTYNEESETFGFNKRGDDNSVITVLYDKDGSMVSQNNQTAEVSADEQALSDQNEEAVEASADEQALSAQSEETQSVSNEVQNESQTRIAQADNDIHITPKNAAVEVVKWQAGSRDNNCLENIIRNNYDLESMGISLYSEEYLELEKAVMKENPKIYGDEEKGIEGRKKIIDGTRHNSVLYVGDTIILPEFNYTKSQPTAQADETEQTAQTDETEQAEQTQDDMEQTAFEGVENGRYSYEELSENIENIKESTAQADKFLQACEYLSNDDNIIIKDRDEINLSKDYTDLNGNEYNIQASFYSIADDKPVYFIDASLSNSALNSISNNDIQDIYENKASFNYDESSDYYSIEYKNADELLNNISDLQDSSLYNDLANNNYEVISVKKEYKDGSVSYVYQYKDTDGNIHEQRYAINAENLSGASEVSVVQTLQP